MKAMAFSWGYHGSPPKAYRTSSFSAQKKNRKMSYVLAACWLPAAVCYSECNPDESRDSEPEEKDG